MSDMMRCQVCGCAPKPDYEMVGTLQAWWAECSSRTCGFRAQKSRLVDMTAKGCGEASHAASQEAKANWNAINATLARAKLGDDVPTVTRSRL